MIHNEAARLIYQESFEETIADGRLNSDETVFLETLQRELRLSQEAAQRIYSTTAQEYLARYLQVAISDERFSPKEEEEINAISKSLGVRITYNEETKSLLDRYRLYWMIEHEALQEIEVGIKLQRNEKCYLHCDVDWYQYKRRKLDNARPAIGTHQVRDDRPMLRTPICQPCYWRMNRLGLQIISDDVMTQIDSGRLFLTNKGLIFRGTQENITIGVTEILDLIPYQNGVEIREESGQKLFLGFSRDIDIFAVTLGRVIQDFGPNCTPRLPKIVELW
jgi:hypothetical protein